MKKSNWIQLALLVLIFSIGIVSSQRQKKLLKECSIDGKAQVVDKYKIVKRGYFIKYKYKVEGVEFFTSESLKKHSKVSIGDTINIEISCKDFNISKMIKE